METEQAMMNQRSNKKEDPWEPFVANAMAKEDERERMIRYRAGYRALLVMVGALLLFGFFSPFIPDTAFTLEPMQLGMLLFAIGSGAYLIYVAFRWPAFQGQFEASRVRFTRNRASRRYLWTWIIVSDLFAIGIFFILNYYMGGMPFWKALGWSVGFVLVMSLLLSGPILKKATRTELEQWEEQP